VAEVSNRYASGMLRWPGSPRWARLSLWAAVLALALALRVPALTAGLPYFSYVDEGHVLHPALKMAGARSWDPGWYQYPSLPMDAIAGAVLLSAPTYAALHGHPLADDLTEEPSRYYDLVEPAEVIVVARLLVLAVSLGIVLLTGLLARRLAGDAAGLFAALLAALVPALVIRGAIVTTDPWAAFFVLAAIYCAEGAVRAERPSRAALQAGLAGAMIGCALTSKYPGVLVAVAVVPTLLRVAGDWRRRVLLVGIATAAALLAAALTMPALVLRSREVMADVARQARLYGTVSEGYWHQAVGRAEWDQPFDGPELGVILLGCALLGGVAGMIGLRDRRLAGTVLAWALYAGTLAFLLCRFPLRPFRNLLPLVPLVCVLAALLLVWVRQRVRRPAWVDAAAALAVLALLLPGDVAFALDRAGLPDARSEAIAWVAARTGPEDTVLVSEELAVAGSEFSRLRAEALVLDVARARARLRRRGDVKFVITGELASATGLPDLPAGGRPDAPFVLAALFGEPPGTTRWDSLRQLRSWWRSNDETVLVYRRTARRAVGAP
jgi:hypothetical protein